jgi:ABC-2 type transport system permease protein
MTSNEGRVYDVGYKPFEGELEGSFGLVRSIALDTMRRALGLRRRGRSKIVPWALVAGTTFPALVTLIVMFFSGSSPFASGADPLSGSRDLLETVVLLSLLFTAFIGPTALIPDRRDGVLNIYRSRPVRARDYLLGRIGGTTLLVMLFVAVPLGLLFAGQAALHPDGIFVGVGAMARHVPSLAGTILALSLAFVSPVMLVSLWAKRSGAATGMFMVAMLVLDGFTEFVREAGTGIGSRVLVLLSPIENLLATRDWLLNTTATDNGVGRAVLFTDMPIWSGAVVIGAVAVVTAGLALWKYKKELGR